VFWSRQRIPEGNPEPYTLRLSEGYLYKDPPWGMRADVHYETQGIKKCTFVPDYTPKPLVPERRTQAREFKMIDRTLPKLNFGKPREETHLKPVAYIDVDGQFPPEWTTAIIEVTSRLPERFTQVNFHYSTRLRRIYPEASPGNKFTILVGYTDTYPQYVSNNYHTPHMWIPRFIVPVKPGKGYRLHYLNENDRYPIAVYSERTIWFTPDAELIKPEDRPRLQYLIKRVIAQILSVMAEEDNPYEKTAIARYKGERLDNLKTTLTEKTQWLEKLKRDVENTEREITNLLREVEELSELEALPIDKTKLGPEVINVNTSGSEVTFITKPLRAVVKVKDLAAVLRLTFHYPDPEEWEGVDKLTFYLGSFRVGFDAYRFDASTNYKVERLKDTTPEGGLLPLNTHPHYTGWGTCLGKTASGQVESLILEGDLTGAINVIVRSLKSVNVYDSIGSLIRMWPIEHNGKIYKMERKDVNDAYITEGIVSADTGLSDVSPD